MKKKGSKKGERALVGTGLAVAAAAGYLLYKNAPKITKRKLRSLISGGKKEAAKKFKSLKVEGEKGYQKAVAAVLREYRGLKNIDPKEIAILSKELKGHWRRVKKSIIVGRK